MKWPWRNKAQERADTDEVKQIKGRLENVETRVGYLESQVSVFRREP